MLFDSVKNLDMQGTAVNIIVGTHVWVEDPTVAWIDGQVKKITGKDVEIETTNGNKVSYAHLTLNYNSLSKSFVLFSASIQPFRGYIWLVEGSEVLCRI